MSPGPRLEQWLRDAGFENVQSHKYVLPLGTWPKDNHYVSTSTFLHPLVCWKIGFGIIPFSHIKV
jgi:hypothetical protein